VKVNHLHMSETFSESFLPSLVCQIIYLLNELSNIFELRICRTTTPTSYSRPSQLDGRHVETSEDLNGACHRDRKEAVVITLDGAKIKDLSTLLNWLFS